MVFDINKLNYSRAVFIEDFDKYCQLVDIFDTQFTLNLNFQYPKQGFGSVFLKNLHLRLENFING